MGEYKRTHRAQGVPAPALWLPPNAFLPNNYRTEALTQCGHGSGPCIYRHACHGFINCGRQTTHQGGQNRAVLRCMAPVNQTQAIYGLFPPFPTKDDACDTSFHLERIARANAGNRNSRHKRHWADHWS